MNASHSNTTVMSALCKGTLKNWRLKIIQALLIRIKRINMSHFSRYHPFPTMKKEMLKKDHGVISKKRLVPIKYFRKQSIADHAI